MFKISQGTFGPSAATSYNLGLCFLGLGNSAEALTHMVEAADWILLSSLTGSPRKTGTELAFSDQQ